jgi:mannosyltransferase PIG-V
VEKLASNGVMRFWPGVFGWAALTRAVLLIVSLVAVWLLPTVRGEHFSSVGDAAISAWSRWDGGWYLSIAQSGYRYEPGHESNVAFAPLLPALMRAGGVLLGTDDRGLLLSGIGVANLSLLVALGYLVALVKLDFDDATAARTALYLLVYPGAFFLSAVYPQAPFLACVVASLYYARRGRWWVAGAIGAVAALARPYGVLLAIPLAYEYLRQRDFRFRSVRADVLPLALVPASAGLWAAYLGLRFGDPFVIVNAARAWGRFVPPWEIKGEFSSWVFVDLAFALALAFLVVQAWRTQHRTYAIYATLIGLAAVFSGQLASGLRYALELFPAFIALAVIGAADPWRRAYTWPAFVLENVLVARFALGYWVG